MNTKVHPSGRIEQVYKSSCGDCKKDTGYARKSRVNNLCKECVKLRSSIAKRGKPGPNLGKKFSKETRLKISLGGKGRIPWNKGLIGVSEETSKKMSLKKVGKIPANKDVDMSLEQRVKLSCVGRGIEVDDFDDFVTDKNRIERNKYYEMNLHTQCFQKYDFTCDICKNKGTTLNAHHLNSWKHFPEQRFDIANLVTLCSACHRQFHAIYGNGKATPNTKEQYLEFKENLAVSTKKIVYILAGAPASGKSWVASQLSNFDVVDSDIIARKDLKSRIDSASKPLLTLTVGVSTFIKRNPQFECRLVVIKEDEAIINARMLHRGGKITTTIARRISRMETLAKQAVFCGNSNEVLEFLKKL